MRVYCGGPGRRDGMRNTPSELEGCLGIKIANFGCFRGCIGIFFVVGIIATAVILILKFKYHMF